MRARPKVDEARDILANVVVCHVPVVHYNFQQKVPTLCTLLCPFNATVKTPCDRQEICRLTSQNLLLLQRHRMLRFCTSESATNNATITS